MLKTRVATGALLTVVMAFVLCFSHISWLFNAVIAALSLQSVFELFRATENRKYGMAYYGCCVLTLLISFVNLPGNIYIIAIVYAATILTFAILMKRLKTLSAIPLWLCCALSVAFSLFFKAMSAIRGFDKGIYILIGAVLVGVFTDIAAYFVGKGLGKRKIAPIISPNKTVEGCIGGTVISVTALMLLAMLLDLNDILTINYILLAVYLLTASVIGQFGDFSLSAIKRIVQIKDYGKLLPGHGGILDRFDSMLFVLPYTYLFFSLFEKVLH